MTTMNYETYFQNHREQHLDELKNCSESQAFLRCQNTSQILLKQPTG